jgi:hypothetical protein
MSGNTFLCDDKKWTTHKVTTEKNININIKPNKDYNNTTKKININLNRNHTSQGGTNLELNQTPHITKKTSAHSSHNPWSTTLYIVLPLKQPKSTTHNTTKALRIHINI